MVFKFFVKKSPPPIQTNSVRFLGEAVNITKNGRAKATENNKGKTKP